MPGGSETKKGREEKRQNKMRKKESYRENNRGENRRVEISLSDKLLRGKSLSGKIKLLRFLSLKCLLNT
jgi:hypothetical protein